MSRRLTKDNENTHPHSFDFSQDRQGGDGLIRGF